MKFIDRESKTFDDFIIEKEFDGGSPVQKFIIKRGDYKYLLRVFDARFIASREVAYKYINLLHDKGINVPNALDFGTCNQNTNAYMILEWIEGKSIEETFNNASFKEQQELGYKTGVELEKFHFATKTEDILDISELRAKIEKKKAKFTELGIVNNNIISMLNYLENNIQLLIGRKKSVVHGDIHAGNIIVTPENKIFFVDLDVCKLGDPWYDLASNSCLLKDDEYYTGLIDGYFNQNIPSEFWRIYTLYGCLYCLDYVTYSIRTKSLGLEAGLNMVIKFIETSNGLSGDKPCWYKNVEATKKLRRMEI